MSFSLYIHWPFCKSKCPYCDFNSHVRESVDYSAWLNAYVTELRSFADQIAGQRINSIFFGGGTPSLMPASIVEAIIDEAARLYDLPDTTEITLEANPTSVEAERFKAFRAAGINRVSLGVQSLNAEDLRFLGREHNVQEALAAIELARSIFPRYSFDLIYARPHQTLAAWERELDEALALAGTHLSLYQLTIEKGTPFYSDHRKGVFAIPDEHNAADFFALTQDKMTAAGMPAYEISNHAAPGYECRHNLAYWYYEPYLGIGPGAHSRMPHPQGGREALMMIHHPENWLEAVKTHNRGIQSQEKLSDHELLEECLMMGLRLTEGITRDRFRAITGHELETIFPTTRTAPLIAEGLLTLDSTGIRATAKGQPLVNGIVVALLPSNLL